MFTGIVEEVGQVISFQEKEKAWELCMTNPFQDGSGVDAGASISVNGCCLTLIEQATDTARFELLEETLRKTNLGSLSQGSVVNLERALAADGRLGGHFVSGHVDTCGEIAVFEEQGKNLYLQIAIPPAFSRYLVDKGSIAVNGCSLTVCDVLEDSFAVWLIPHTLTKTNLADLSKGDAINLEFDMLAKYVEKLSRPAVGQNQL
jgi:riboflavin synthase